MTWMQGNPHEPIPPGGQLEPDPASLAPGLAAATGTAGGGLRSLSPYGFDDFPSYHCEPKPPYFLKGDFPACHVWWIWSAFLFCGKEEGRILQMLEGTVVVGSNHYVLGWSHPKSWLILVGCTICLSVGPYCQPGFAAWTASGRSIFSLKIQHGNWSQRSKRRQQLNWNPPICRTCTCRCLFFVICWITQPL